MAGSDRLRLTLARGQIALGALALRAGLDVGMVEGPAYSLGAGPRADMDQILARARSGLIDYRLGTPKHEFLSYLVHECGYLLHGTASPDLDAVRPKVAVDYDARTLDSPGIAHSPLLLLLRGRPARRSDLAGWRRLRAAERAVRADVDPE